MVTQKAGKTLKYCNKEAAVAQKEIFKEGAHSFHIFSRVFFFGRTNFKLIEKQEKL